MIPEALIAPDPDAENPLTPVDPAAVHESLLTPDGTASDTDTPVASLGPLFFTTTVYVTDVPATTLPCAAVIELPPSLSVFVTDRSACCVIASVSVALLLLEFESAAADTVAVSTSDPVADDATLATTV